MRKQSVEGTLSDARKACPWAAVFCKTETGYLCFESVQDADTWRKQK